MSESLERAVHAYCDGELSWWARTRFEARLRRSPDLRRRLEQLRALSGHVRESQAAIPAPDVWPALAGALGAEDARLAARPPLRASGRRIPAWGPLGAVAAAVAAAIALLVLSQEPSRRPAPAQASLSIGTVRFLDTEGAPVLVQDRDSVTIIWLMDSGKDQV